MRAAMNHRGPDESAIRTWDGLCGLGINRLSIMDVQHGHQPLSNGAGDVHVVCNGEIYNHAALRQDLIGTKTFATHSDAEVIVHLYEDLGEQCVEYLDGMFAFVIYDGRKRTFFAARDRYGIKPLYYLRDGQRWLFASEAKAFLGLGLDLKKVELLPPGCALTPAGVHRYYDLGARRQRSVADPQLLFSILDASVRRHLMTDPAIKVGTFLSGGIDSSFVTAIAAKYRPDLVAFTVGMPNSPDVAAAALVAKHLNIEHVVVPFTLEQIWDLLPSAVFQIENYNPLIVLEGLMQIILSNAVRKRGIKVMLCGEGSDEIFAGYGVYRTRPATELHRMLRSSVGEIHNTECLRVDRATMAHSVEARLPFLDPMVVEYAINLPASDMIKHDGERLVEKWILRKSCEHLLPPEITWRMKLAFDHGSGILRILDRLNEQISDAELDEAQRAYPHAAIANKAILFLYRLFRSRFGDMGSDRVFEMFGHYPTLQAAINNRSGTQGGTGEVLADLERLSQSMNLTMQRTEKPEVAPLASGRGS